MTEFIRSEIDGGIATVTLNRPGKLNSFTGSMRQDLAEALRTLEEGKSKIRVVILTGEGRGFSAGGDVDTMSELQERRDVVGFTRLLNAGMEVVTTIRDSPLIFIAAVNGVAAGAGLNLALACDYRIASDASSFGSTFVRIGMHPDWGGTWLLPRLIGTSRALELMLTGRIVDPTEAMDLGLVDRVVPAADLMEEARKLATAIAEGPPIPVRDIKQAVYEAFRNDLRMQIRLETENQLRAFLSDDAREGMEGFREKRKPEFRGE
ncbi:MAG: enoyl-CoA hydratase/isomerase family protein [Acidobacteria bacterium]|nr:enoyl-CoA hydratase/isomerase family protein [Acidobacteriota bacterium]